MENSGIDTNSGMQYSGSGRVRGRLVMKPEDFSRHVYIIGATGSGKTTVMRSMAKGLEELNRSGRFVSSLCYIDPKGDDALKFLGQVQDLDPEKVTYLDPVRANFSINPLELPPYQPEERERVVSLWVGYFMALVREWFRNKPEEVPRMLNILERLVEYLYHLTDSPSFIDLYDLVLTLQTGSKEELRDLLEDAERELGRAEAHELAKALNAIAGMKEEVFDPVLTRIARFATDPFLKKMFSTRRGTVDFTELLKPGHITIIRIATSDVGLHVQPFMMSALVMKVWFSILYRAGITEEAERCPVVLAIDEFQHLQGLGLLPVMLAEARSFKLGLILAHQSMGQMEDRALIDLTMGNAGTQLAFQVSGADAKRIAESWDPAYFKEISQELTTLPEWLFLARTRPKPGGERAPPMKVTKPMPAPPMLHGREEVNAFILRMRMKYGGGVIERSIFSPEGKEAEATKWMSYLEGEFPSVTSFKILLALSSLPATAGAHVKRVCELAAFTNEKTVRAMVEEMYEEGVLRVVRSKGRRGAFIVSEYGLTEKGRALISPDVQGIGGEEGQALARRAIAYYHKRGTFVGEAKQTPPGERPDLIAFDYDSGEPIDVEIESSNEVETHPEQVKHNMTKWREMGFKKLHVWTLAPAAERVKEIRGQLPPGEQKDVQVFGEDERDVRREQALFVMRKEMEGTTPAQKYAYLTAKGYRPEEHADGRGTVFIHMTKERGGEFPIGTKEEVFTPTLAEAKAPTLAPAPTSQPEPGKEGLDQARPEEKTQPREEGEGGQRGEPR